MIKLFFISFCLLSSIKLLKSQDLLATTIIDLQNQIERIKLISNEVPDLEEYYDSISTAFNFSALWNNLNSGHATEESCNQCKQFISLGKSPLINAELLVALAHSICKTAGFYSERVCDGTIERVADPIIYIVQHTKLTTEEICSVLINPLCMPLLNQTMTHNIEWELPLPPKKAFNPIHAEEKTLNMLHLTDVHLDLWYTEGSNSECGEPLCCRSTSYGSNYSAGYWSETYGDCDTPLVFAESSIKHISNAHKDLNFVIWTGDSVPHDVWNTTEEVNLLHLNKVTKLIKQSFNGTPVYPCLGNHEAHPINLYVPYEVSQSNNSMNHSMKWLYDTVADNYWSEWLNSTEAKATFKKGGYYSKMVTPTLKLVALNNNVGYRSNFWIAYNPVDPDGQLAWLIQQLDEAESNGHYVMIIGHIPPGGDYYSAWNHNYIRIVDRYQHLVVAAYNGHTHDDEIVLLYSRDKNSTNFTPIGVNYVSPSLTTFTRLNPGYRVFQLNQNGQPLDISNYYSDVIESNKNGRTVEPKWKFLYTPKIAYNLTSLTVQSWAKFVSESATNDVTAQLYYNYYHRNSLAFDIDSHYNITQKHHLINGTKLFDPYVIN